MVTEINDVQIIFGGLQLRGVRVILTQQHHDACLAITQMLISTNPRPHSGVILIITANFE